MANVFKSYREASRTNWGITHDEKESLTHEQLQTGAILRIADATEKMAGNFIALQNDRDLYKRCYANEQRDSRSLRRQLAGLKGEITKLKKKLAPKP